MPMLILILVLFAGLSQAFGELPARCTASNVYRMDLPQYYDRVNSPKFSFSFQILWSSYGYYAPFVIYLTGGPGFEEMGHFGKEGAGGVPNHYNVILVDQRGVGCNAAPDSVTYPYDFYKTPYLAQDLIEMIKALKLTNYYIHGLSYGTVHATVATRMIEQQGVVVPRGLILQGVVGKRYLGMEELMTYYNREWSKAKALLLPQVLNELTNSETPFGFEREKIGGWARESVYLGDIPGYGPIAPFYLNPLVSSDPAVVAQAKATIQAQIDHLEADKKKNQLIQPSIFCQELVGPYHLVSFVNNQFVTNPNFDVCTYFGIPTLTNTYDSANYQVRVPIYYFIGEKDPSTPPEHGQYHFDRQIKTKRQMVTVTGAGHFPLAGNLQTSGQCAGIIWDYIVYAPDYLPYALYSCKIPVTYKVAFAQ